MLKAALLQGDLSPLQRTDVENVAAEYYPAYDELCQKMIASVEGLDCPPRKLGPSTDQDWIAFNDRKSARDRLRFDRRELNLRIWQKLREILNEDQAKRSGAAANPPEADPEGWDFGS